MTNLKNEFQPNPRSLIENTLWGIYGEFFSRVVKFSQLVIIAKYLGVESMGLFNYALASAGVLSIFYDFGILVVATKNNTKDYTPNNLIPYFVLKFFTSSLGLIFFTLILLNGILINEFRDVIFLLVASVLISDLANLILASYRAKQDFLKEAKFRSIVILLQFLASITIVILGGDIKDIAISLLFINLLTLLPLLVLLRHSYQKNTFSLLKNNVKNIFTECIPYSGVVLMGALYTNLDILLLGYYMDLEDVAIYSVAMKFILGVIIIPVTFLQNAQVPNLVSNSAFNEKDISMTYANWLNGYKRSTLFGFLICIFFAVFSTYLIYLTFGSSFADSANMMALLTIVGLCYYLYTPIITLFIISKKIKISFYVQLFCCILNLFLLVILIPKYQIFGAVMASIITHMGIFFLLLSSTKIFFDGLFNLHEISHLFKRLVLFFFTIYFIVSPELLIAMHPLAYKIMISFPFLLYVRKDIVDSSAEFIVLIKSKFSIN